MAGTLRPSDDLLTKQKESEIIILESYGGYSKTTGTGLVSGLSYEGYSSKDVMYWYSADSYVKFQVKSKTNIWCIATDGNISYTSKLKLLNSAMVDVTSKYCNQKNTNYTTDKWQEWITELPTGVYYVYGGYNGGNIATIKAPAVHGEWYGECCPLSFAVKNNNNIYVPIQSNYNESTGMYNAIDITAQDANTLDCNDLLDTPDYLNGDRVIDKFNGDIRLIKFDDSTETKIKGIKSARELVVASGDINNGVAQTINSIMIESTKSGNSSIKLALSIDNGDTWKTYDGANWQVLGITIPKTETDLFSASELEQWNNARDVIYSSGIDVSTFNSLNFNTLTSTQIAPNTIRFAYVLDRPNYSDDASTTQMTWNFNAKGSMGMMLPTEYKVSMFEHQIKFTSLIDSAMMVVNVII